jgi:sec-independent protein translocase protein TatA
MTNPLIGMPQGLEWLVILAIVVLVFGAAKLPDLARSSGQALRIFKTETKSLRDDDDDEKTPEQREIEARNEAQREVRHDASGEVLRERRDDTTA